MDLEIEQLAPIGARIVDPDVDALLERPGAGEALLEVLEANGVVLLRGLHLDDVTQLALGRRMGEIVVKHSPGWSEEHPGIYRVAMDPNANSELYVKGTFDWHFDGATAFGIPPKASMLSCRVVAGTGGNTEFVSTYHAYDRLSDAEKAELEGLKVWHQVRPEAYSHPIELDDADRERLANEPAQLHPLVWTHQNGRKSLAIGVTASHVEGMPTEEGRSLLRDLLDRASRPELVLSHHWEVDDVVLWDNTGVLHRVQPYAGDSGRDMHRVTLVGDEPIQ